MKKQPAQNYIMTLNSAEFGPFLYFLDLARLPVELDGKVKYGKETIQLSMCMPLEFDPSIIRQQWQEWKEESLDSDYAVLN